MEKNRIFSVLVIGICSITVLFLSDCGKKDNCTNNEAQVIEKVKMAMLCNQRYCWEHGVAMQSLIEIGDTIGAVNMAYDAVLRKIPDGRLAMLGSDWAISDAASNGPGVFFAYKVTGEIKYKIAADSLYLYLMNAANRTPDGLIRHNTLSQQIYSDNSFMQNPFLIMMGNPVEAMRQTEGMRKHMWDSEKKLFYHIYDVVTNKFEDKSHWGGGNGWNAAGMAQMIDLLSGENKDDRQKLISYTKDLLDGCIAHQLPDGLFYDKIDQPNFPEVTLGLMLAYTIYRGVKSGWLEDSYLNIADKIRKVAWSKIDKYGQIQSASSAPNFDRPGTSTECQAFFLLMEGAFQKLHNK
jgi:unsaturated rhamnogalacturonyl hydrolase